MVHREGPAGLALRNTTDCASATLCRQQIGVLLLRHVASPQRRPPLRRRCTRLAVARVRPRPLRLAWQRELAPAVPASLAHAVRAMRRCVPAPGLAASHRTTEITHGSLLAWPHRNFERVSASAADDQSNGYDSIGHVEPSSVVRPDPRALPRRGGHLSGPAYRPTPTGQPIRTSVRPGQYPTPDASGRTARGCTRSSRRRRA